MYIYNTSFFIGRDRSEVFERWFGAAVGPRMDVAGARFRRPRLTKLCMAAGAAPLDEEAQSYAFQLEFDSIADAQAWADKDGAEIVEEFMGRFAPDALTFSSMSEVVNDWEK